MIKAKSKRAPRNIYSYGRIIRKSMDALTFYIRELQANVNDIRIVSIQRESMFFGMIVRYIAFYERLDGME